jgi:hypothetical protein
MQTRTAASANPYSFAANNPVKFIDQSGAQPVADQGGAVAGGLAAIGALIKPVLSPVPGENVEPYIEMKWACNADRDCVKAVETAYPLTEFEQLVRKEFHSGKPSELGYRWGPYYHVVLDKFSGALLGYAMFETNVIDIYDRQGKSISVIGRSEGTGHTWFQPGDFLAGPIASWVGIGRSAAARGVQAAVESGVADEAASGGVADALVGTGARQAFRRQVLAAVASDANHPLRFLIDESSGQFKTLASRAHANLIENPDVWEAGHILSDKLGGVRLMIQSAWENQVQGLTVERLVGVGVLDNPAIGIGGLAVAKSTAGWWESLGWLVPGTVERAPVIP